LQRSGSGAAATTTTSRAYIEERERGEREREREQNKMEKSDCVTQRKNEVLFLATRKNTFFLYAVISL